MKRIISAFAVLAIVGTTLAFTPYFGSGSVYCGSSCDPTFDLINYKVDPSGSVTDPCNNGTGGEYVLTSNSTCVQVGSSTNFSQTAAGK